MRGFGFGCVARVEATGPDCKSIERIKPYLLTIESALALPVLAVVSQWREAQRFQQHL